MTFNTRLKLENNTHYYGVRWGASVFSILSSLTLLYSYTRWLVHCVIFSETCLCEVLWRVITTASVLPSIGIDRSPSWYLFELVSLTRPLVDYFCSGDGCYSYHPISSRKASVMSPLRHHAVAIQTQMRIRFLRVHTTSKWISVIPSVSTYLAYLVSYLDTVGIRLTLSHLRLRNCLDYRVQGRESQLLWIHTVLYTCPVHLV